MAIVSDVEIRLRADIARLQQDLNAGRREVNSAFGSMSRAVESFKSTIAGLAVGAALTTLGKAAIDAQREFDKLNSSLITATGSAEGATQAFSALQAFAAKTPYDLKQVTEAFLKLRNLGLTPSERALTSYGNTAAAMGKDLSQLIEAVADAATGEFERLKEFGIKAKVEGDKVAFTFQGVKTAVKNNAAEIEKYLMSLGETKFAGGMELQSKTLDGAISNLADTWQATLRTFSQSGFGDVAQVAVLGLSNSLMDLQAIIKAVAGETKTGAKAAEDFGESFNIITTIFETIAVLGLNVKYVMTQIGNEIGGMAAQFGAAWRSQIAFMKGDFKGAADELRLAFGANGIGAQMRADAEAARAALDAQEKAILGAAAAGRAAREEAARDTTDKLERYKIATRAIEEQSKAEKKAREEAEKWAKKTAADITDEIALIEAQLAATTELTDAQKKSLAVRADMDRLGKNLTKGERDAIDALLQQRELLTRVAEGRERDKKAADERAAAIKKETDAAWEEVRALQEQVKNYGLTTEAVMRLKAANYQRQLEAAELAEDERARISSLLAATEEQIRLQEQLGQMKAATGFWTDLDTTARQTFLSIADGGKGLAQRLKDSLKNIFFDWLYQQTLRKWIINVGTEVIGPGAVSGIPGATGGAVGGITNMLSMAKSAYTAITTGFESLGTAVANGVQAGFNLFGTANAQGIGNSIAAQVAGEWASAGAAALAGAAAGIFGGRAISKGFSLNGGSGNSTVNAGTAIGMVFGGPLGAALGGLAGGAINRLFGRGPKEITSSTLTGNLGAQGFSGSLIDTWKQKGGVFRSDKSGTDTRAVDTALSDLLGATYKSITENTRDFAKALGVSANHITDRAQAINVAFTGDEEANKKAIADFFVGVADTIATELVPTLGSLSKEGETAAATLQRVSTQYVAVNGIFESLSVNVETAFGAVGVASLAARERLLSLTGGVEALATQTGFFAQNFLSEAQRIAPAQKMVAEQLAKLGYSSLTTTEQFADAVLNLANSGQTATEEGAKLYAGLLALAPAFKQVADFSAAAAQKLADANAGYQKQIDDLLRARLSETELLALETAGMDASTRALFDRLQALKAEDAAILAAAAAEQAANDALLANVQAYIDGKNTESTAARSAADTLDAVAQQRAAMELQLFNLTHTAAEQLEEARRRELAAVDPLLKGLQLQIYAQQDLAVAATAAARQIEEAAARARAVAQERAGIERNLLTLQGNTGALRALELAALDETNRALQQQYYDLQDKMAAEAQAAQMTQAMAEAQARAAEEAMRAQEEAQRAAEAAAKAWSDASASIMKEILRIRGVMDKTGVTSLSQAQAAFATATAQARAGDVSAAAQLPELSRALLDLAETNARTSFDLRLIRAQTAASLQQTLGYTGGAAVPANGGVVNAGMQQYNTAYAQQALAEKQSELVAEIRMLRTEAADRDATIDSLLFAIARNTGETTDVLQKFDVVGLPPERTPA